MMGYNFQLVAQERFLRGQEKDILDHDDDIDSDDDDRVSAWLVSPYFFLYFSIFIINSIVWPVQLLERACISTFPQVEEGMFVNTKVANSCIASFISPIHNNGSAASLTYETTIGIMLVITTVNGVISLVSYILLWKPLLKNCQGLSLFVPPVMMLGQSLLMSYSQSLQDFNKYKYALVSAVLLPSLHGGWQGMFFLLFHLTYPDKVQAKKTLFNTKIDGSHGTILFGIFFAGLLISGSFDMKFNFLSFFQFALVAVIFLYSFAMLPYKGSLLTGDEQNTVNDDVKGNVNDCNDNDEDSTGSEDEFLLASAMQHRKENVREGKWWQRTKALKEAPLIFTETKYQMELIMVAEVCVFTIAVLGDTDVGVFYIMDIWHTLDFGSIGLLIVAQGFVKTAGLLIAKVAIYYAQITHGTFITLALLNYVLYYIMLTFAMSKTLVTVSMFVNFFGALAFPTIFLFIKINLHKTAETVIELSILLSFIVALTFGSLKLLVYGQFRVVFPGASFAFTASVLLICGVLLGATYITSTIKYQRKSKDYADKLLNSNQ